MKVFRGLPSRVPLRFLSFRVVEVDAVDEEGGTDTLGRESVEDRVRTLVGSVVEGEVDEGRDFDVLNLRIFRIKLARCLLRPVALFGGCKCKKISQKWFVFVW